MKTTTSARTRVRFVVLAVAAATLVVAPIASGQRIGRRGTGGRYAFVNGLKMYYEVRGPQRGTPIVFLHGAFSNIESDFERSCRRSRRRSRSSRSSSKAMVARRT